ncbi:hypothetical protein D3C78_1706570 [compost metagenome]
MLAICPILIISKIIMVGLMPGKVICQIFRMRLAPSTSAASYKSLLIPVRAAR